MFKKVYSLYSPFCTQPAFYSQSAVCILHSVCILPLAHSLQSAVHSLLCAVWRCDVVSKKGKDLFYSLMHTSYSGTSILQKAKGLAKFVRYDKISL